MGYAGIALVVIIVVAVALLLLRKASQKSTNASLRPSFKMSIDDVFSIKTPGVVVVGVISEDDRRPARPSVGPTGGAHLV
jgi:GTPase